MVEDFYQVLVIDIVVEAGIRSMFQTFIALIFMIVSVEFGHAAYYNENRMEEVIFVRQNSQVWESLPDEIPPMIGSVALEDCNEIGSLVWLWHESPPECAGPYWVVDCRAPHDAKVARRKNIIVEVNFRTAQRWEIIGYGPSFVNVGVIRIKVKNLALERSFAGQERTIVRPFTR